MNPGIRKRSAAIAFWLLAMVLTSVPMSAAPADRSGMTFCPLEKKWVKKSEPQKPTVAESVDEFCSPKSTREQFKLELATAVRTGLNTRKDQSLADLFFSYSRKGSKAFVSPGQTQLPKNLPSIGLMSERAAATSSKRHQPAHHSTNIGSRIELVTERKSATVSILERPLFSFLGRTLTSEPLRGPPSIY